jgi:hypothetical protein
MKMKFLLTAILMMFATQVFAESAAEASNRVLAERQNICSKTSGSECYRAIQASDAAVKRLLKEAFVDGPEARRQHEQEVIQDEQLRQRVRQRGY